MPDLDTDGKPWSPIERIAAVLLASFLLASSLSAAMPALMLRIAAGI